MNILNKQWFWYIIVLPITLSIIFFTGLSFYGIHQDKLQLQEDVKEQQIFNDGVEKGRFDQLNESAMENSCFNISSNSELNTLLEKYFKNCRDAKLMWAIAQSESHGNQMATNTNTNKTLDCGWAQNNSVHKLSGETQSSFCERMKILEQNVSLAKEIKDTQGWSAWTQFKNGAYLTYLK